MNNNQKATKRALLTSVMALVMCVVMLVGTTFAWFTDTASTGVNKIQAGNLDVALEMKDSEGKWVSAEGQTLQFKKAADAPADEKVLWEPGCTYELPELRIVNKGNLALKYKISISGAKDATPDNDKNDLKLLDVIDWTYSVSGADGDATDELGTERYLAAKTGEADVFDTLTIKGQMQKSAGNDYQGMAIEGIAITVVATQDTVESDSFSKDYDENATYPVVVTPDTAASVDYSKSNAVYQFAAGTYSGLSFNVGKNSDVVFEAADGAVFDNVTIGYKVNRYNETDKSESTMTIRGFRVNGVLSVNSADGNLVIEDNYAKQIKVVMNRMDGKENANIQIKNNNLDGGKYGIELVPNHSNYSLTISGNKFSNITSNAISVMGYQSDLAATDATRTTAASITVKGNTFNGYGTNKAAFKIWGDTVLAPNSTDNLSVEAVTLAESVKTNNGFDDSVKNKCNVADFYGKTVAFTTNP